MKITTDTVDKETKLAMVAQLIELGCTNKSFKNGWDLVKSSKVKTIFMSKNIGNDYYMIKYPSELFSKS
tara:strand:+ start:117 stop:323 length:207 start_codon:yes stop_codon:yes gene_type:complete